MVFRRSRGLREWELPATWSGKELDALVKAASEGLGFDSLASDLGVNLSIQLWVDSSAAKSMRLGKTK